VAAKIRRVWINGQRWTIRRCRVSPDRWGDCCYETKTIRISDRLTGEAFLNTLVHELIHARWPDLNEQAVRDFADELTGVIHAEGFRDADD